VTYILVRKKEGRKKRKKGGKGPSNCSGQAEEEEKRGKERRQKRQKAFLPRVIRGEREINNARFRGYKEGDGGQDVSNISRGGKGKGERLKFCRHKEKAGEISTSS